HASSHSGDSRYSVWTAHRQLAAHFIASMIPSMSTIRRLDDAQRHAARCLRNDWNWLDGNPAERRARPLPNTMVEGGGMTNVQTVCATPDQIIERARSGQVAKLELAELLKPNARKAFLNFCGSIEKRYTEACTAKNDPCLEGGCALEGEVCLQPLER